MITTPYGFEGKLSGEEFRKIGQFALRWSHMDHTIGNCLRRLLEMSPAQATVLIFPLSLDLRMARIGAVIKTNPLTEYRQAVFDELKPAIKAMQFLRTSAVHGIVIDLGGDEEPYFHLRSKERKITKDQLFGCEQLINYAAHVTIAFRLSLGDDHDPEGRTYALPGAGRFRAYAGTIMRLSASCSLPIVGPRSKPPDPLTMRQSNRRVSQPGGFALGFPPMTDWLPVAFEVVVALALMTAITAWVVLRNR